MRGEIIIPEHKAPVLPVATLAFSVWDEYRETYSNMGDTLFPSVVNKRRHDRASLATSMHPSTMFRRLQNILSRAGICKNEGGEIRSRTCGQTLRNSYAAHLIESGADNATLIEALGFEGYFSAQHLRQAYMEWSANNQ